MPKPPKNAEPQAIRAVAYLRVSTAEQAASGAGLAAQRTAAEAEVQRRGWVLEEVFIDAADLGVSRRLPWARRPQARLLLDAVRDGHRAFDHIVVGEPQRAFMGSPPAGDHERSRLLTRLFGCSTPTPLALTTADPRLPGAAYKPG